MSRSTSAESQRSSPDEVAEFHWSSPDGVPRARWGESQWTRAGDVPAWTASEES